MISVLKLGIKKGEAFHIEITGEDDKMRRAGHWRRC